MTVDQHGFCELTTTDDARTLHTLTGWSLDHDIALEGLVASRPSLEDTYLQLVSHDAADAAIDHRPDRSLVMSDVAVMSDLALVRDQIRYEQKSYWRNPLSALFTFAFPADPLHRPGQPRSATSPGQEPTSGPTSRTVTGSRVKLVQYYTPSILAYAVMSASFLSLSGSCWCASARPASSSGCAARPLPAWAYLGGVIGSAVIVATAAVGDLPAARRRRLRRVLPRQRTSCRWS